MHTYVLEIIPGDSYSLTYLDDDLSIYPSTADVNFTTKNKKNVAYNQLDKIEKNQLVCALSCGSRPNYHMINIIAPLLEPKRANILLLDLIKVMRKGTQVNQTISYPCIVSLMRAFDPQLHGDLLFDWLKLVFLKGSFSLSPNYIPDDTAEVFSRFNFIQNKPFAQKSLLDIIIDELCFKSSFNAEAWELFSFYFTNEQVEKKLAELFSTRLMDNPYKTLCNKITEPSSALRLIEMIVNNVQQHSYEVRYFCAVGVNIRSLSSRLDANQMQIYFDKWFEMLQSSTQSLQEKSIMDVFSSCVNVLEEKHLIQLFIFCREKNIKLAAKIMGVFQIKNTELYFAHQDFISDLENKLIEVPQRVASSGGMTFFLSDTTISSGYNWNKLDLYYALYDCYCGIQSIKIEFLDRIINGLYVQHPLVDCRILKRDMISFVNNKLKELTQEQVDKLFLQLLKNLGLLTEKTQQIRARLENNNENTNAHRNAVSEYLAMDGVILEDEILIALAPQVTNEVLLSNLVDYIKNTIKCRDYLQRLGPFVEDYNGKFTMEQSREIFIAAVDSYNANAAKIDVLELLPLINILLKLFPSLQFQSEHLLLHKSRIDAHINTILTHFGKEYTINCTRIQMENAYCKMIANYLDAGHLLSSNDLVAIAKLPILKDFLSTKIKIPAEDPIPSSESQCCVMS